MRDVNVSDFSPRFWWAPEVPNMEFIRSDLSRHLRDAGPQVELAATVLSIHWAKAQIQTGGILAWEKDWDLVHSFFHGDVYSVARKQGAIGARGGDSLYLVKGLRLAMRYGQYVDAVAGVKKAKDPEEGKGGKDEKESKEKNDEKEEKDEKEGKED